MFQLVDSTQYRLYLDLPTLMLRPKQNDGIPSFRIARPTLKQFMLFLVLFKMLNHVKDILDESMFLRIYYYLRKSNLKINIFLLYPNIFETVTGNKV